MVSALAVATAAFGQNEVTTYKYDALGRLTGSSVAGGPVANRQTGTCFDPAGNRVRYDIATSAPAACPGTPTPTPTPTPTNQPPVPVTDSAQFNCSAYKTINVTGNDTDPENNTPLSVVSASAPPGMVWVSGWSSTSVTVGAGQSGSYWVTYVVADSLGATATGTVNLTVNGDNCLVEPFRRAS